MRKPACPQALKQQAIWGFQESFYISFEIMCVYGRCSPFKKFVMSVDCIFRKGLELATCKTIANA
jgi:hypothetical protein